MTAESSTAINAGHNATGPTAAVYVHPRYGVPVATLVIYRGGQAIAFAAAAAVCLIAPERFAITIELEQLQLSVASSESRPVADAPSAVHVLRDIADWLNQFSVPQPSMLIALAANYAADRAPGGQR